MISGKNITLRAMEPTDVDLLYELENQMEMWYLSNTITPFSRFVLEQFVLNSHQDIHTTKQLRLMIDLPSEEACIGTIDLFEFDPTHKRVGLGIILATKYREQGYAAETLDMVLKYCFETLLVHQVYCNILSENERSLELFKSRGFEKSGLKKDWILTRDGFHDEYHLQLIKR